VTHVELVDVGVDAGAAGTSGGTSGTGADAAAASSSPTSFLSALTALGLPRLVDGGGAMGGMTPAVAAWLRQATRRLHVESSSHAASDDGGDGASSRASEDQPHRHSSPGSALALDGAAAAPTPPTAVQSMASMLVALDERYARSDDELKYLTCRLGEARGGLHALAGGLYHADARVRAATCALLQR
jgi:hypothetical protein